MYELLTPPNSTSTFCLVGNPNYYFADRTLLPWIDIAVYVIIPTILITFGNTIIMYKVIKAGITRTDMTQLNTSAKPTYYKILPMLLLVSTFFVATSLPICVYFLGKIYVCYNMCSGVVLSNFTTRGKSEVK